MVNENVDNLTDLNKEFTEMNNELIDKPIEEENELNEEITKEKDNIIKEIDEMNELLDNQISHKDKKLSESEILERMKMSFHLNEVNGYLEKNKNNFSIYNKLLNRKNSIIDSLELNRLDKITLYTGFDNKKYKVVKKAAIKKINNSKMSFPNVDLESSINSLLFGNPLETQKETKKFLFGYYNFIMRNSLSKEFEFIYFLCLNLKFFKVVGLDDDRLQLKNSILRIINK